MPLRLQQNRKHARASEQPLVVIKISVVIISVALFILMLKIIFTCVKNSSAPSINAALWHYLGTSNLDFRHENNSTPGVLIEEIRYTITHVSLNDYVNTK